MTFRTRVLVCAVVAGAGASMYSVQGYPARQWFHFLVYLVAIVLSSGMKVAMPKSNGTMTVNFPFILLGIVQLAPYQTVILAVCTVMVQCRFKVIKPFAVVQILFNVANVITATVLACQVYAAMLPKLHSEVAPALALAVIVYFLANTIPVAVVIGWESGNSPIRQWCQGYPWYFPFYLVGAILAAAANFIGDQFGWLTSMLLVPMVYTVYRAYTAQMAIIRDREQHIIDIEALFMRTVEGLAMAIEAKDSNTHGHLMRVRVYVSELAKIRGLDEAEMKALVTAAYLHDIGKLAVPESILNKPGKLNPAEFSKMKIHPVVGAEILERVKFPYPVVPIVRSHHEAWDGSGYPDGLKGEEIPIGARILTAVDCFDALVSERPYRKPMPLEDAMAFMKNKAGSQFDPEIVQLLEEHYPRLERQARETTGEMTELDTDLCIERGAAPGAGFAQEGAEPKAGQTKAGDQNANATHSLRQKLIAAGTPQTGFASLSQQLMLLVPCDYLAVYRKSGDFIVARYFDGHCDPAFSTQPTPVGEGLSGWVAEHARSIVNGNPTVETNFEAATGFFTPESSALSVPLAGEDGDVAGVLTLYAGKSAAFSNDHLLIVERMAPQFAHELTDQSASGPMNTSDAAAQPDLRSAGR